MKALLRLCSGRIPAALATVLLLTALLFSAFFIAAEGKHHCEEEHCPVCACLQECLHTLQQIAFGPGLLQMFIGFMPAFLRITTVPDSFLPLETPVSRKVRLND